MVVWAMVVGASSSAWVTVVAAALTGLLGLAAGASAAAVVTARQQTIEVFRNRMIEAADNVVVRLTAAIGAARFAEQVLSERRSFTQEDMRPLLDAAHFRAEMEPELARLYVVFPNPHAADLADAVAKVITEWIESLRSAYQDTPEYEVTSGPPRAERDLGREVMELRDELLREMNRQIRLEGRLNPFARGRM